MRIDYEKPIPKGSKLIGEYVLLVKEKYGFVFQAGYYGTNFWSWLPLPNTILTMDTFKEGMSIRIFDADPKVLAQFRRDYELP